MKTFEASRLSEGNKLFPAKIDIDNFGVTLKIPGLLGGKEKTLSYQQISSVSIESPMMGYSKITFDTLGFDRIVATGFSKADAQEIKQMVQQGISGARSGGGNNSNQDGVGFANQQQPFSQPVQPQDAWGSTVESISNRLSTLNSQAQTDAKDKEKKAKIVEDMEFGIMRLRSIGANTEADFFEKKLAAVRDIKKKWYE